jgi:hypothetical protein
VRPTRSLLCQQVCLQDEYRPALKHAYQLYKDQALDLVRLFLEWLPWPAFGSDKMPSRTGRKLFIFVDAGMMPQFWARERRQVWEERDSAGGSLTTDSDPGGAGATRET